MSLEKLTAAATALKSASVHTDGPIDPALPVFDPAAAAFSYAAAQAASAGALPVIAASTFVTAAATARARRDAFHVAAGEFSGRIEEWASARIPRSEVLRFVAESEALISRAHNRLKLATADATLNTAVDALVTAVSNRMTGALL